MDEKFTELPDRTLHVPSEDTALWYGRKLVDLYTAVRSPDLPPAGIENGKDKLAREALILSSMFVHSMAGWAIDHIVGRAHNNCIPATSALVDAPQGQYEKIAAAANDERHETDGHRTTVDGIELSSARKILAELLALNPGAFPPELSLRLAIAMTALDFGEVPPIVAPTQTGKHGPAMSLAILRVYALEHVQFNYGAGLRKSEAENLVAMAFNVDRETVVSWAKRAPKKIGERSIEDLLFRANQLGRIVRDAAIRGEAMEHPFTPEKLRTLASEFHSLQRAD